MHGRRWRILAVGMVLLAQAAAAPTGVPATPSTPSADMLLDLDLLREMSMTRDRELLGLLRLRAHANARTLADAGLDGADRARPEGDEVMARALLRALLL